MRRIPVENLQPGMKLARPVYVKGGRILINAGYTLKQSYIKRLPEFGITHIYIEDERVSDIYAEDIVNEETRMRAANIVHESLTDTRYGTCLNVEAIKQMVIDLMKQIFNKEEAIVHLSEIRIAGEQLFHHSVNVSVFSLIIGILLGYNDKKLLELGMGALLHDIGKSKLPAHLIDINRPLSTAQKEEIQNHTIYGFEILRKESDLSLLIAHVAFQHHENLDGSGYPRGIKGEDIHEYARITAVANTYDRLIGGMEEEKILPHQAIEYLLAHSGCLFDTRVVKLFSANIAVYPIGSMVLLNTGEKGIVTAIPKNYPTRPQVRILYDKEGNSWKRNYPEVNLLTELTVFIEKVLEE